METDINYTDINYSKTAKIFLPSHHACERTPRMSRLVPSHRALRGGRGEYTKCFRLSKLNEKFTYLLTVSENLPTVTDNLPTRDKPPHMPHVKHAPVRYP